MKSKTYKQKKTLQIRHLQSFFFRFEIILFQKIQPYWAKSIYQHSFFYTFNAMQHIRLHI